MLAATVCTFWISECTNVSWSCGLFKHFDLEMCFAAKRRALLRHLNFQKWSAHGVFCTVWLGNLIRARTACTFSTSELWNVHRSCQCFTLLTSKCASRHRDEQFFISHLASWLPTRRFNEPTFQPSGAIILEKHNVVRLFCLFAHLHLLSSDFSYLLFSSLLFWLSSLLFSCPYCLKFDLQTSFDHTGFWPREIYS